jgi:hypothetical protein
MFSGDLGDRIEVLGFSSLLDEGLHTSFGSDRLNGRNYTSLTADFAAFWQISVISAPEKPSVI